MKVGMTDVERLEECVIKPFRAEVRLLKRIVDSFHTQFGAAMRATSLGLCKRVIKHALEDERELRRKK